MSMQKQRTLKKAIVCAADVLWLWLIFSQSLYTAEESSRYSGRLTRLLQWIFGAGQPVDELEHLVRKLAHFTEFFILGALTAVTLAVFGFLAGRLFRLGALPFAALAGLLAALCDETLQLTSAGRSPQVGDVWLDWAGYLCGLFVCAILIKCRFVNDVRL